MSTEKKKKIRRKPGQVFQVPLGNGEYAYGQTTDAYSVFFDYKDDGKNPDIEDIILKPVLFKIGVAYYAIKEEIWPILGVLPVNPEFEKEQELFTYNNIKKTYVIWKTALNKVPATPEEIYGLECFASWGAKHVERRLRDHFAGRPNYTVELFRNEHNPDFERNIIKFYAQHGYEFKLPSSES